MNVKVIPATRIGGNREQKFTYHVPDSLSGHIKIGQTVEIPFGKRTIFGIVAEILDDNGEQPSYTLKDVVSIKTAEALFTPQLFALADYISQEYLTPLGLVVKAMMTKPAVRAVANQRPASLPNSKQIELNEQQQSAVDILEKSFGKPEIFLLHGVTGSGKTEVYLKIIEKLLTQGKQSLIMVPEIALTPQTLSRIESRFPADIIEVVHSRISYGQKFIIWKNIFEGKTKILIGPRSALFAPFVDLGLIVMDEEHDPSFKQFDQNPKYHSRFVAGKLSKLWNCPLLFSDATPSLESYFATEHGQATKIELTTRPSQEMPQVKLVDMREETKAGNFNIFSEILIKKMESALEKGRQVILFINRRGTATSMLCQDCGELVYCQSCQVPLVFHNAKRKLVCHHCGRNYDVPITCGKCGSQRLKFSGTGTEKVEFLISKIFPQYQVARLDRDNITKKSEFEKFYSEFMSGKFQILVGTQMIAKGWDLSGVSLIGVINADTTLSLPDFRSNERTFQLVTQVSGRAGRGSFPGEVILQTHSPENFAIRAATKHNYKEFYEQEIEQRQKFDYPPISRLIKLTTKGRSQDKAMESGRQVVAGLKSILSGGKDIVLGPSPAFIPRVRGSFIVYVIIKLENHEKSLSSNSNLRKFLLNLSPEWDVDVDPDSTL